MPRGRPRTFEITLTETERTALADLAGSRSLPAGLVRRAMSGIPATSPLMAAKYRS